MKRSVPFLTMFFLMAAFILAYSANCIPALAVNTINEDVLPDIQTHSMEGIQVSFRPVEGRIQLILFWDTNSWRANQTAAWALDLYREFHKQGLDILGICTDSLEDDVMEFSQRWQIPWPQVPNAESAYLKRTAQFGIIKTPSNRIVDAQGKILVRDLKEEEAYTEISRLLGLVPDEDNHTAPVIPLTKRDWGAEQATGEPDTSEAGDFATAWASATPDDQTEWLLLHYEQAIRPAAINIHETNNPGAVTQVSVFSEEGKEIVAWTGIDPTSPEEKQGVSQIPLDVDVTTRMVKIYLDSQNRSGCNEIDAVELVDPSGHTQWAIDAQASSSFADNIQFNDTDKGYLFPTDRSLVSFSQVKDGDRAIAEMKEAAHNSYDAKAKSYRYHIKAFIDGTSVLAIHRNTARWYRPEPALEGMKSETVFPTYINGSEWRPEWPGESSSGWSTMQTTLYPSLPTQAIHVSIKNPKVEATNCGCEMNKNTFGTTGMIGQAPKGAIYILQQPCAENDYALAIAFDDFGLGGSNIYDCFINIRIADQEVRSSLVQSQPNALPLR